MINIRRIFTETQISKLTSLFFLKNSLTKFPQIIQLEHTTKCNLKCEYCLRTNEINSDMAMSLFKLILKQLKPRKKQEKRSLFLTGLGEPFLNPKLFDMIRYGKKLGFQVGLTSNMTIMNQSIAKNLIYAGLDHLHVSIDYACKELFEFVRKGADFERVVSNTKLIVNIRNQLSYCKPKIILNATVVFNDFSHLFKLINLAKTLKVDGIAFNAQISPRKIATSYHKLASLIKRLSVNNMEIKLHSSSKICDVLNGCYITFDGKVLPCPTLVQLIPRKEYWRFQFGDLKNEAFNKIWFSKKYRLFRVKAALGLLPNICKYCPQRIIS